MVWLMGDWYRSSEDLLSNGAKLEYIQGTASKGVCPPWTVPGTKVQKCVACHVLPGTIELSIRITWSKSYYVARKHGSMQAHSTFEVAPSHSYAAVFHAKAQIVSLDAK